MTSTTSIRSRIISLCVWCLLISAASDLFAQFGSNASPYTAGCPCVPARESWGYYQTKWHRWPGAPYPDMQAPAGNNGGEIPPSKIELPNPKTEVEMKTTPPARPPVPQNLPSTIPEESSSNPLMPKPNNSVIAPEQNPEPRKNEPAAEPATKEPPSAEPPSTEPPSAEGPSTNQSSAEPPATNPPRMEQSGTNQPAIELPSTQPQNTKQPSAVPQSSEQPSTPPSKSVNSGTEKSRKDLPSSDSFKELPLPAPQSNESKIKEKDPGFALPDLNDPNQKNSSLPAPTSSHWLPAAPPIALNAGAQMRLRRSTSDMAGLHDPDADPPPVMSTTSNTELSDDAPIPPQAVAMSGRAAQTKGVCEPQRIVPPSDTHPLKTTTAAEPPQSSVGNPLRAAATKPANWNSDEKAAGAVRSVSDNGQNSIAHANPLR